MARIEGDTMNWKHPLEYVSGREMNFNPVNLTLEYVAEALKLGRTAYVHLEPGDGERCEFFLIPMWNDVLALSGGGFHMSNDAYIFVAPANLEAMSHGNAVTFIPCPESIEWELEEFYRNEWTAKVVAHFIANLYEEHGGP